MTSKGGVNPLINDFNNLKSTLIHEKGHKTKGHGFRKITFEEHANVYLDQMNDITFGETKIDYKKGHAGSFAEYVLSAHYNEPDANSTDLINSYNSKSKNFKLSLEQEYKLDNQGNILENKMYINVTDSKGNTGRVDYDKKKTSN